jgi:hypothetical protein
LMRGIVLSWSKWHNVDMWQLRLIMVSCIIESITGVWQ